MKTFIVVNPASNNGATGKNWPSIEMQIKSKISDFDFGFTDKETGATNVTRGAIKDGYEHIIALGGDGTLSQSINGFFEPLDATSISSEIQPINKNCIFSFIMKGRGNDFQRTFNKKNSFESSLERATHGTIQPLDLIHVQYTKSNGQKATLLCLNITSFGMSGEVVANVNKSSAAKLIGGSATFILSTLQSLVSYQNRKVSIKTDGREMLQDEKIRTVIIANGQYAGGGMHFAPKASTSDGKLDLIIFGDINSIDTVMNSSKIYSGKHLEHDKVNDYRASVIEASSKDEVLIDVDGECVGKLPIKLSVLPAILKIQI